MDMQITTTLKKDVNTNPVAIQAKPIGYITCDEVSGNDVDAISLILYFSSMNDIPYFILKEAENSNGYIVETGNFTKGGIDYNARCRMNKMDFRLVIPENIMKIIEPKPVRERSGVILSK